MPLDAVTQNQRTDADNLYAAPDGDGAGISHTVLGLSIGVPIRGTITLRDRRRSVTSAQVMVADMRGRPLGAVAAMARRSGILASIRQRLGGFPII
jgi:hypothetical protein